MRKDHKEKVTENKPETSVSRDEALFEALGKTRKQRKRRIVRTIVIILVVLAVVLVTAVSVLRRRVWENYGSRGSDVLSYEANIGTISTVVSGSGTLSNVDTEIVELPVGVELKDVLVEYGDVVSAGDLLATVEMSTVRSAMSDLQTQIEQLDDQISEAEDDRVDSGITAGVSGRVKIIYAERDDSVADVMVKHGALAVLSLDGYMALELESDALTVGDAVSVFYGENRKTEGTVESVAAGVATILVTDNGPKYDEQVTVCTEDGAQLGTANLYIHNPLAVTGFAGTISNVSARENSMVSPSSSLFRLTDTSYSANYDTLLRQRSELEQDLLVLLAIQKYGGITAPISGSVFSAADPDSEEPILEVASLSPDVSMSVTITVDESDILSLELDQQADVMVSSVAEDLFVGTVTEIDKSAATGYYTAQITLDKAKVMLPGMTADVDVRIQGEEDTIIIPVSALHQTSAGYYVYTSYDAELEEYGGRTDVTVGISNDDYVQIKSGLQPGDMVYYTETMTIFDLFNSMAGMSGGGAPDRWPNGPGAGYGG